MNTLRILSWNIRGLEGCKQYDDVKEEFAKADIVVLTETWLCHEDASHERWRLRLVTPPLQPVHYVHHYVCKPRHGGAGRQRAGISVYIRSEIDRHTTVMGRDAANGILWLKLARALQPSVGTDILLACCYFPPDCLSDPFEVLEEGLHRWGNGCTVIVVGDLNARTGSLNDGAQPPRVNSDRVINQQGRRCVDFCLSADLAIANGRVPGDTHGAPTFCAMNHTDGKSTPDLVLVDTHSLPRIQSLVVVGDPKYWGRVHVSDHSPVLFCLTGVAWTVSGHPDERVRETCTRPRGRRFSVQQWPAYAHQVRLGLSRLQDEYVSAAYEADIPTALWPSLFTAEDMLCKLAKTLKTACAVPRTRVETRVSNDWWDEECKQARSKLRRMARSSLGPAHPTVKAESKQYKALIRSKKQLFATARMEAQLQLFFKDSKSFFAQLRPSGGRQCPITDMAAWRQHLDSVSNVAVSDVPANPAVVGGLSMMLVMEMHGGFQGHSALSAAAASLNDPITATEVSDVLRGLVNYKAADPSGLIAEMLKYAVCITPMHEAQQGISGCMNMLAGHLAYIFNTIMSSGALPKLMCNNDMVPVFKKGDAHIMDNYRGITVSSIFSKVYSSVWEKRLSRWAEGSSARSETQFGFRPGLGNLHAVFLLHHMVDKQTQPRKKGGQGKPLYVCFIDFQKAFDSAPRANIFARLVSLGVHGRALQAIEAMYAHTEVCVKLGGQRSESFTTTQGVKQGDPLSPLLFGLFIEMLHELLSGVCASVGMDCGIGKLVRDLLFADDAALVATTAEGLQRLLDTCDAFCTVFGMKVNVSKTEIVVFGQRAEDVQHVWRYKGQQVHVADSFVYLGYPMYSTGHHKPWKGKFLESGRRASFALSNQLRELGLYSPELQLRLFDTMVKPVMCYGCQIWGAAYAIPKSATAALENPMQKLHMRFLRHVSGAASHVPLEALLQEFSAEPIVCYGLKLALRFWNTLASHDSEVLLLAFRDNVRLAKLGMSTCWAGNLLNVVAQLDDTYVGVLCDGRDVHNIQFDVDELVGRLRARVMSKFHDTSPLGDPRTWPSDGVKLCAYRAWFDLGDDTLLHPHIRCRRIAKGVHRTYMRFRLGCTDNAVNLGRMQRQGRQPRAARTCPCCRAAVPEDELHMVFECSSYSAIRSFFSDVFIDASLGDMRAFFSQQCQDRLALFIDAIVRHRKRVLCQQ